MNHHQHGWQCNQGRNCPDLQKYIADTKADIAELEREARVSDYCIGIGFVVFCVLVIAGVI